MRVGALAFGDGEADQMLRILGIAAAGLAVSACGGGTKLAADLPRGASAYAALDSTPASDSTADYRIGPLDSVSVSVFQEPELSTTTPIQVDASGDISLPLVGLVRAAGKTGTELSAEIAQKLGERYLVDPQVTVAVVSSVSQKVTVQGEVTEPGVYDIKGPTTLLEALSLAKGETRVAALKEVVVFRTIDGKRYGGVFDVQSIRAGAAQDPKVVGNDVIVVGLSRAKTIWRDVVSAAPVLNVFRPLGF